MTSEPSHAKHNRHVMQTNPISQYIVDTWTALAKEEVLNKGLKPIAARVFTNTSAPVTKAGTWKPVQSENWH
jgi:hypothetical protein